MHIHERTASLFLPPWPAQVSGGGAHTPTQADHLWLVLAGTEHNSLALVYSIPLPAQNGQYGAYLRSVDVWFNIDVLAAGGSLTLSVLKGELPASGSPPAAAALDSALLTPAAPGENKLSFTLQPGAWLEPDHGYWLKALISSDDGWNFYYYGARLNFELRR